MLFFCLQSQRSSTRTHTHTHTHTHYGQTIHDTWRHTHRTTRVTTELNRVTNITPEGILCVCASEMSHFVIFYKQKYTFAFVFYHICEAFWIHTSFNTSRPPYKDNHLLFPPHFGIKFSFFSSPLIYIFTTVLCYQFPLFFERTIVLKFNPLRTNVYMWPFFRTGFTSDDDFQCQAGSGVTFTQSSEGPDGLVHQHLVCFRVLIESEGFKPAEYQAERLNIRISVLKVRKYKENVQ